MASTNFIPNDFHVFSPLGVVISFGIFAVVGIIYTIGWGIYNLYFHPLSHIPGPFLARASGIPYSVHMRSGSIAPWIQYVHKTYGDAVRISPGEVSFISGETAWQDIYGFRIKQHKTPPYLKDRTWLPPPINGTYSLIGADEAAHSRARRNLSHAFSDKALRDQEPLIQGFVDLLVKSLKEECDNGKTVDIMRWYNYTTFDVIADLTFGEPLYCLRDKGYHPWVRLVFATAASFGFLSTRRKYAYFDYYDRLRDLFKDHSAILRARKQFFDLTRSKVAARIEKGVDRPDFFTHVLKNQESEEKALTREEMDSNAVLFLVAGSETTATVLSGTTFLVLRDEAIYEKLVAEVRGRFKSEEEITIEEVNKLGYMIACLQEGLRYYPPVPTGFPRVVPVGGDTISGRWIPEGTAVQISQHAANHSPRNFKDPDSFVPERWLGSEKYKDDNRAVVNPFSFGPRNCLGKNLAYAEMRLILAKVLFNFDIELVDKQENWMSGQKVYTLWEKPALEVRLRAVER